MNPSVDALKSLMRLGSQSVIRPEDLASYSLEMSENTDPVESLRRMRDYAQDVGRDQRFRQFTNVSRPASSMEIARSNQHMRDRGRLGITDRDYRKLFADVF